MIVIDDTCIACEQCTGECPAEALSIKGVKVVVDHTECLGCQECVEVCPMYAIRWEE